MILALLAQDVSTSLELSDRQMGLLLGAGFSIVYALAGIPLAGLVDRGNRRNLIGCGVILWSLTTAASGFAQSFSTLFVLRCGVALGEAVLTPAAISMIADLFAKKDRVLPTAVYGAMASIMGVGALFVGSAVLAVANSFEGISSLAPWRLTLVILGSVGTLLAVLFLGSVSEPRRCGGSLEKNGYFRSFGDLAKYLRTHWKFYGLFYAGLMLTTIVHLAALSWLPTIAIRKFGLLSGDAGYLLGAIGAGGGLISALFWSVFVNKMTRLGRPSGSMIGLIASSIISMTFLVIALEEKSLVASMIALFVSMIGIAATGILGPLVIQQYGPPNFRGRLISLYLLTSYLISYTFGPLIAVYLSDMVGSRSGHLDEGISFMAMAFGPFAAIAFCGALFFSIRTSRTTR